MRSSATARWSARRRRPSGSPEDSGESGHELALEGRPRRPRRPGWTRRSRPRARPRPGSGECYPGPARGRRPRRQPVRGEPPGLRPDAPRPRGLKPDLHPRHPVRPPPSHGTAPRSPRAPQASRAPPDPPERSGSARVPAFARVEATPRDLEAARSRTNPREVDAALPEVDQPGEMDPTRPRRDEPPGVGNEVVRARSPAKDRLGPCRHRNTSSTCASTSGMRCSSCPESRASCSEETLRARSCSWSGAADNGRWALPAGIVEPGEQPAVCIQREILEETMVEARVERLALLRTDQPKTYPNGDRLSVLLDGLPLHLSRWRGRRRRRGVDRGRVVSAR